MLTEELKEAQLAQDKAIQALQESHQQCLLQLQQSIVQAESLPALINVKQAAERLATIANARVLDSMRKRHDSSSGRQMQHQALAYLSDAASTHPFSFIWAAAYADQLPKSITVSLVSLGATMPCVPVQYPAAIFLYDPGQDASNGSSKGGSSSMSLLVLNAKDRHIKADLFMHHDLTLVVS